MENNRLSIILIVTLGMGLALSPVYAVIGKSIVTVNGDAIFLSEFDNNWESFLEQRKQVMPDDKLTPEWEKQQKKALLDQMIEEKLLLQEATRRSIKVPKRQLEEGVMQVKNRFKVLPPNSKPSKADLERELTAKEKADFSEELKKQNITEKEFEQKIEGQLKVLRLTEEEIRGRIGSPFKEGGSDKQEDRELSSEYEKETRDLYAQIEKKFNQKDFKPEPDNDLDRMVEVLKNQLGETVRARHILIKSPRDEDFKKRSEALGKIRAIKKELDAGADFEELCRKKSDGPSANNGGDLGFFTRGQMVPEFDKAAFALPVGGISDIVETPFGYHIIQVEEKKAAQKLRYNDIKMDLAGYLYQKKGQDRYDQFVEELKKKADIKVLYNF